MKRLMYILTVCLNIFVIHGAQKAEKLPLFCTRFKMENLYFMNVSLAMHYAKNNNPKDLLNLNRDLEEDGNRVWLKLEPGESLEKGELVLVKTSKAHKDPYFEAWSRSAGKDLYAYAVFVEKENESYIIQIDEKKSILLEAEDILKFNRPIFTEIIN